MHANSRVHYRGSSDAAVLGRFGGSVALTAVTYGDCSRPGPAQRRDAIMTLVRTRSGPATFSAADFIPGCQSK